MKLTSENVKKVFDECLTETAEQENAVKVEGIVRAFAFDSAKLKEHTESIFDMLRELPKEFMQNSGGGYSFLMACNDKDGNQWTGLHERMEQLFALGIGIEKVKCLLPRELWQALPGGVPYYVVLE